MTMKDLYDKMASAGLQMQHVLVLAGMLGTGDGEGLPELLDELLDGYAEQLLRCFPDLPVQLLHAREDLEDDEWRKLFCEWALQHNKLGLVVQFATAPELFGMPVSTDPASPCPYRSAWLYGDSLEEVVQRGLDWDAACRAQVAKT